MPFLNEHVVRHANDTTTLLDLERTMNDLPPMNTIHRKLFRSAAITMGMLGHTAAHVFYKIEDIIHKK